MPDPNDPATFERSKLDWPERDEGDHARLLELYRALAQLRRRHPQLTDPRREGRGAQSAGAGRWALDRGDATVYVNLSGEPWTVDTGDREVWFHTVRAARIAPGAPALDVPPDAVVVLGPAAPMARRYAEYTAVE